MFSEDALLPISALQHLLFCRRQCALIHIERVWAENVFTVQGGILHERAHEQGCESHDGIRVARAVSLRSLQLGLTGVADVVEFHPAAGCGEVAFPVEYKRGRPKSDACDTVQLCAQALCLEEMLGRPVPAGALFYAETRRRIDVPFDTDLRALTLATIAELAALFSAGRTPPPTPHRSRCKACSLLDLCRPEAVRRSAVAWRRRMVDADIAGSPP